MEEIRHLLLILLRLKKWHDFRQAKPRAGLWIIVTDVGMEQHEIAQYSSDGNVYYGLYLEDIFEQPTYWLPFENWQD